jgi:hypothetical protein
MPLGPAEGAPKSRVRAAPLTRPLRPRPAPPRPAPQANGPDLATCALRPSGIFGEGDTVMVPTLVRQARAGKMKYIIGSGKNKWDLTYVGNVAQAHLLVGAACAWKGRGRGLEAGAVGRTVGRRRRRRDAWRADP